MPAPPDLDALVVAQVYAVPMSMIDGRPWVPTAAESDPGATDDQLQDEIDDLAAEHFYLGDESEPAFTIPDDCPVCLHEWRCVCPPETRP